MTCYSSGPPPPTSSVSNLIRRAPQYLSDVGRGGVVEARYVHAAPAAGVDEPIVVHREADVRDGFEILHVRWFCRRTPDRPSCTSLRATGWQRGSPACMSASRSRVIPWIRCTNCTNPEQSIPNGEVPPHRYGHADEPARGLDDLLRVSAARSPRPCPCRRASRRTCARSLFCRPAAAARPSRRWS